MRDAKLTVVVSAGQSRNPEKRSLEKSVAELSAAIDGVNVVQIPHLYDIASKGESFQLLRQIENDLVVLSWLFDRAAHWVLDRNGVRGQVGEVELSSETDEEFEAELAEAEDERVTDSQPRPQRRIYNLDFRVSQSPAEYEQEIRRILTLASEASEADGQGHRPDKASAEDVPVRTETLERLASPTNDTFVGSTNSSGNAEASAATIFGEAGIATIDEHPGRRWYPVIDFSRCTNCMECIDFCLFGVYGVDNLETIVVEQADNCRKGCPACSRVCPQNAIIFPQHKTPAIAGAPVDAGGLKIDLSKLFGAPESDEDPAEVAARERDEQLILAGRQAVGTGSIVSERLAEKKTAQPKESDELDGLLDELDALDL